MLINFHNIYILCVLCIWVYEYIFIVAGWVWTLKDAATAPSTAMCVSFDRYATETSLSVSFDRYATETSLSVSFDRYATETSLGSVAVKADAHCSARNRRRIREASNPACDYKNIYNELCLHCGWKDKSRLHCWEKYHNSVEKHMSIRMFFCPCGRENMRACAGA